MRFMINREKILGDNLVVKDFPENFYKNKLLKYPFYIN